MRKFYKNSQKNLEKVTYYVLPGQMSITELNLGLNTLGQLTVSR
jgi:hypothetical protein